MEKLYYFINNVLLSRKLSAPDGRMLYAYQLNKTEYRTLQNLLSEACATHSIISLLNNKIFPNAFVLYAAEWWKREYNGGLWSWDPIFSSLSVQEEILPYQVSVRTQAIKRALRFWKYNNPLTSGKKYLGAIVANGGIPAKFLQTATQNNAMIRVLKNVITFAKENDLSDNNSELYQYARENLKKLPESLRNGEICTLITQLASTIINLKEEYHLQNFSNPIAELNNQCSDWKDQFPLLLEDESIEKLLIGFIEDASRKPKTKAKGKIPSVERLIDLDENCELVFNFTFPEGSIDATYFKNFFNVADVDKLPPTFYINNLDENRTTIAIVSSVLGSVHQFKIRKLLNRLNACDEVVICLSSADNKLSSDKLLLCQALNFEKPLIFTKKEDNTLVLRANDSIKLSEDECFIAYDKDMCLPQQKEDFGYISVSGKKLKLIKFTSDIETENFYVKLNVPAFRRKIIFQGTTLNYKTIPCVTYKGTPKFYYLDVEGEKLLPVNDKYLKYFAKGAKIPLNNIKEKFGTFDIFYSYEGHEKTYTVAIVPQNAKIMFYSENNIGKIIFENFCCLKITPHNIPSNITISSVGSNTFMCTCQDHNYPDELCFKINWQYGGYTYIKVPYPISGVLIYDEHHHLYTKRNIGLKHLLGKKIKIFHTTSDIPNYDFYMGVHCGNKDEEIHKPIFISDDGIAEIKLIDFEEDMRNLLSYTGQEDGFVQVEVRKKGKDIEHLRISKYDVPLKKENNEIFIPHHMCQNFSADQLEKTKVYALPFLDENPQLIELTQQSSDGVYTGIWNLENIEDKFNVFIVFSSKNSAITLQPQIIYNPQNIETLSDLQRDLIENQIQDINQYEREDFWKEIMDLLSNLYKNEVPLTVFDIFQYICSHDQLLCDLLLRSISIQDQHLFHKLKQELFIIPATIPISCWKRAIEDFKTYSCQGLDENYTQRIILHQAQSIVSAFPEIEVNVYYTLLQSAIDSGSDESIKNCLLAWKNNDFTKTIDTLKSEIFSNQEFNSEEEVEKICWVQVLQAQNPINQDSWIKTNFMRLYDNACTQYSAEIKVCNGYLFDLKRFNNFMRDVINFPQICAFYAYFSDNPVLSETTKLYIKEFFNFNSNYFIEVYKIASLIICKFITDKKVSDEKK